MLSVHLLGRLVFDVEIKEVGEKKDKKVLNNKLAISLSKEKTTFIDIEAWGSNAEIIEKYFAKGSEILVEGQLVNRTKKKDDVEFETVGFLVDKIIFTYGNKKKEDK